MINAKLLKQKASLAELAKPFGFNFLSGYGNSCPYCGKPNLCVNSDNYFCFTAGCNEKGDIFNLLINTGVKGSFKEAHQAVAESLGLEEYKSDFFKKEARRASTLEQVFELYNQEVEDWTYEYLFKKRGLCDSIQAIPLGSCREKDFLKNKGFNKEELEQAGLLSNRGNELFYNHIIFPFYNSKGKLTHLQGRNLDPETNCRWINTTGEGKQGISHYLFNQNLATSEEVYLTEGVTDGMALIEVLGVEQVISCIGVHPNLTSNFSFFEEKKTLNVVFDNDRVEVGMKGENQLKSWGTIVERLLNLQELLPELKINCILPPYQASLCDVNDWWLTGKLCEESLRERMQSLWDFILDNFSNDYFLQASMLKYLAKTKDPQLLKRFQQSIQPDTSYIVSLLENNVIR